MRLSRLPHIFKSLYPPSAEGKEMLGMRLCVLHNLYFYNSMMEEIRQAIEEGRYQEYKKEKLEGLISGRE